MPSDRPHNGPNRSKPRGARGVTRPSANLIGSLRNFYQTFRVGPKLRSVSTAPGSNMRYVAATILFFALTEACNATDGSYLLDSCNKMLEGSSEVADGQVSLSDDVRSGFCFGSMVTLQQLSGLKWSGDSQPMLGLCVPPPVRTLQYARVVVNYLQAHPEKLHEDGSYLAWEALRAAYPYSSSCKL
ncbi:Rap1a/Tai family immunity protein [Sinorhizobium medicae]|uniref:Rap1a/Tai family immunity protein n=2 Tax=Sinorhizobium medicae TaxID=110321 RepID=UPI00396A17BD